MALKVALAALALGHFKATLPVIIVHNEPSVAKQPRALGKHPEFEVQDNPSPGDAWEEVSPGRDMSPPEPQAGYVLQLPVPSHQR